MVLATSLFTSNSFAYFNGIDTHKSGGITYILDKNVQYGSVSILNSATVYDIPNIQKVEIPEKVTFDGVEYIVTGIKLEGYNFVTAGSRTTEKNKYTKVEEIVLPKTIYNIEEFTDFPSLTKMNIPENAIIGREYVYSGDYTLLYNNEGFYDLSHISYFDLCPKLTLSVDTDSPYYSYKNDLLLSKDGKKVYMSFNHNTDITIPDGIEEIENYGGFGFYHIKSVRLPDTLKILGANLRSVTKITLPDGLEEIGWDAFYKSKLSEIIIPDSVKKIGGNAFSYSDIKSIRFSKNLTAIDIRTFKNCKRLKSMTISANIKNVGWASFRNCKGLKKVKILSSNVKIEHRAFDGCTNLKSVTVKDAKLLVASAFNNCRRLSKITINNKKKAPRISGMGGFKNTKKGLKFAVKNKKVAKGLKKQLTKNKQKLVDAKILVGKKIVYRINSKG